MYEIKKNDYNTVRFLPEYSSGFGNDFQHRQNKKRRRRRTVLILIIAVIIIAAAAFTVYKTFFSPADKFSRAFSSSDFDVCSEIFAENAYDKDFVSEVKDSVTSAADSVFDRYMSGELSSTDAATLLKNYNDASCEEFSDDLSVLSDNITAVESVKSDYETFKTMCTEKNFGEAFTLAMKITSSSEQYGLDYSDEISTAILDNYYDFKASAFYDIAGAFNSRNFDDVTAICTFMLQFSADEDFTDEQETLKKVTDGDTSTNTAARQARQIASAAEDQAKDNAPETSGDSKEGTSSQDD